MKTLVAALVVIAAGCAQARAAPARPRLAELRVLLDAARREHHAAGLAFVAVRDGKVIALESFGLRDVDRRLPVTPGTLFPVGSCTKSFTAIAVAMASDEGRLALDDSPHRLLPWLTLADAEADALVTVRDLLSHRTGLKAYADLAAEPAVLTREEYARAATAARPVARLRARFQYSNAMFTAVGLLLAQAYATSWEAVVERKIFAPLGMTASATTPFGSGGERAVGYVWEGGAWSPRAPPRSLMAMAPAGAIVSTARDLAKWLLFLTAGGVGPNGRLLAAATLREVTRPHIAIDGERAYALGWATYDWSGHAVVEHNGGSQGISALIGFIPEKKVGFALLANSSPTPMTAVGRFAKQIWPLLLGEPATTSTTPTMTTTPVTPPSPTPPTSATAAAGLPSAAALIARALAAHGGEATLRRHAAFELRGHKRYENQGVDAELTRTAAPPRYREEERWRAAGKAIGFVRISFDGERGGQETSFGQDATFGPDELADTRRGAALHPLLERASYASATVARRASVDGEDAFVLVLQPARGKPLSLFISARSGLIVRRQAGDESITYGDFRTVDGEVFPFRAWIEEPLGEVSLEVEQLSFGAATPPVKPPN